MLADPGEEQTADQARRLIGRSWDLFLDLFDSQQLPEARTLLRLLGMFRRRTGPV